jgi:hypothetical protein
VRVVCRVSCACACAVVRVRCKGLWCCEMRSVCVRTMSVRSEAERLTFFWAGEGGQGAACQALGSANTAHRSHSSNTSHVISSESGDDSPEPDSVFCAGAPHTHKKKHRRETKR